MHINNQGSGVQTHNWFDPEQIARNKNAMNQLMAMKGSLQHIYCDIQKIAGELQKMKIPSSAADLKGWAQLISDVAKVAPEIKDVGNDIGYALKSISDINYERLSDEDKAKVDAARVAWAQAGADLKAKVQDFFDPNHEHHAPADVFEPVPAGPTPTATPPAVDDTTTTTDPTAGLDLHLPPNLSRCVVPTSYPIGSDDPTYEGVSLEVTRAIQERSRPNQSTARVTGNVGVVAVGLPLGEPLPV